MRIVNDISKMLLSLWACSSKQISIRPFQKCKIHVCSLRGIKVTSPQSMPMHQAGILRVKTSIAVRNNQGYTRQHQMLRLHKLVGITNFEG